MQSLFTEPNIQAIFGHEAAENEDVDRLRQYYFKTTAFEKITRWGMRVAMTYQADVANVEELRSRLSAERDRDRSRGRHRVGGLFDA